MSSLLGLGDRLVVDEQARGLTWLTASNKARQEQAVIGETPNLAARLQAVAGPDEIVIPENTRRLVGNLFEYVNLGEIEVKGLPAPAPAFRVLRESRISSRFEALRTVETPLIGRVEELELLHRRWAQAKAGSGQVVLISAEPGVGKSRLAEAFRLGLEAEPHTRFRYFGSPHLRSSTLTAGLSPTLNTSYEDPPRPIPIPRRDEPPDVIDDPPPNPRRNRNSIPHPRSPA